MTHQSCHGCKHHGPSLVYKKFGACFRKKQFTTGETWVAPVNIGFCSDLECHPNPNVYAKRVENDNCGPERRHWRAA